MIHAAPEMLDQEDGRPALFAPSAIRVTSPVDFDELSWRRDM
jgi:hypothetical protein